MIMGIKQKVSVVSILCILFLIPLLDDIYLYNAKKMKVLQGEKISFSYCFLAKKIRVSSSFHYWFSYTVIWIISILLLTSSSASLISMNIGAIPSAPALILLMYIPPVDILIVQFSM